MEKEKLITTLINLGRVLGNIPVSVITSAHQHNQWFTPAFIELAGRNWQTALNEADIRQWLSETESPAEVKNVGIIMAGNIPLVGLHDLLSVIVSGHNAMVKCATGDEVLMKFAISALTETDGSLKNRIAISERLNDADMVIATGSDNSARYFDYYFRDKKTLIRKNRTSVAVLTGDETDEELAGLADDIYVFFGLGCRNVTHVMMPRNMDLHRFYTALDKYMDHVHHHKYYNNYMYHKSILLMNLTKHYDHGFMIFQEKDELNAPLATLNYHFYDTPDEITAYLASNAEKIQCVVSRHPAVKDAVAFGSTQRPRLWNYADNINTLAFLK